MPAVKTHRPVEAAIERFAGFSDRSVPAKLTRIECPDLLNVEWSGRILEKRNGYKRLHTNRLRNASTRLDGLKDYYRIPTRTAYQIGATDGVYVSAGVELQAFPAAIKVVASHGQGGAAAQAWIVAFNPSLGAGAGGWTFSLYAGVLLTVNVTDANALGNFRMLECYVNTTPAIVLKVWGEDGTTIGSATSAAIGASGVASTEDILIGAGESAAATVDTTSFFPGSVCELRYYHGAPSTITTRLMTTTNKWYIREIEDSDVTLFGGYWKCNDGNTSGVLADSTSVGNAALPPEEGVAWESDATKIAGTSGVSFRGQAGWIHVKETGTSPATLTTVFVPTTGNYGNFTVRGLLYLNPAPNGGALPDQPIIWWGDDTGDHNLPRPFGVRIVSDQFVGSFDDNGTKRETTITSTTAHALTGKKLRWAFFRSGAGGGSNQILLVVAYLTGNTLTSFQSTATACTGTVTQAVNANGSIARHATAWVQQAGSGGSGGVFGAFHLAHGSLNAVVDHIQLIHCNNPNNASNVGLGAFTSLGPQAIYQEIVNWQAFFPSCTTIFDIPMNEGGGNLLAVNGSQAGSFQATIYPHLGRTVRWDKGLVDPYLDPIGQTIIEYHRFKVDGTQLRETVAISGSTFYKIDEMLALAIPIGAGIFQGGRWSFGRYKDDLIFSCQNGKRPMRWNGATLDFLGIEAPLNPTQTTTKAAGGTFIPGSIYTFYVTFRNKSNGDESNPSPPDTVTFNLGAAHNTIDSINIPISSDPQVNQRRIWMVPPPGTPGAAAYLLQTVDDNITTQWTQDILTPVFVGVSLEYVDNREAPRGAVVEVFKDFAFVGGTQENPTRFYLSRPGQISRWNHGTRFVDLDLDSGDPIVAAKRQVNNLFVSLRDGWARVTPTGDSNNPVAFSFTRRDHGATGPDALALANDLIYYLSERDVYASDGFSEANISSPEDDPRSFAPSIQTTMTSGLNDARRNFASMVYNRSRKQMWIACASAPSTLNNMILVYDITQRIWSKYDIPASTLREIDDGNDQSRVYGIVRGFVCRMDEPSWFDGFQVAIVATATSGSTTTFTVAPPPWGNLDFRGLSGYVYKVATRTLYPVTVYNNTSGTITFTSAIGAAVTALDDVVLAAPRWYADFVVDFGDPVSRKRLKWLRLMGSSDSSLNSLVVSFKEGDTTSRAWSQDGARKVVAKWAAGASRKAFSVGGMGSSFRFRIQDSTLIDVRAEHCPPNIFGRIGISSIFVNGEELGHVI